jgi:glutathione synthase/RimK-type ligase-like ATP-grasp enzyme
MEYYKYLVSSFEAMNKPTLHSERVTNILDNKLLEGLQFTKHRIPIPETFCGFELPALKNIYKEFTDKSIIKTLSDYGGDGVKLSKHPDEGLTTCSKFMWNGISTLT